MTYVTAHTRFAGRGGGGSNGGLAEEIWAHGSSIIALLEALQAPGVMPRASYIYTIAYSGHRERSFRAS